MVENNADNRERLARQIVDDWDIDTLMDFAMETLDQNYQYDQEQFQNDWKNEIGED
jgi:hypothetical protein